MNVDTAPTYASSRILKLEIDSDKLFVHHQQTYGYLG